MKAYTIGELLEHIAALDLSPDAPVVLNLGAAGLEYPAVESVTLYHGADPVQCLALGVQLEPALPTREPVNPAA